MKHHLQPLALAVCAVLGLALAPAAQAATIVLGDPLIPTGLVEGNMFRLAFITSTTHNGLSADIGVYNTFVTTLANGTGSLVKDRGWVWKAMASTTTVDARDNLGLGSITGYPLYRLDNFKLADSYTDFLTHFPDTFHTQPNGDGSLYVDETGIAHGDQPIFSGTATWNTGTPASNWVKYDDSPDGGPLGSASGKSMGGKSKGEGGNWSTDGGLALSSLKYFYAMSEPLEIVSAVPEPSCAVLMLGSGLILLARRRRERSL